MKHEFSTGSEGDHILVSSQLDENDVFMLLDTGASRTCFDKTDFIMAGYSVDQPIDMVSVQTAKGKMQMEVFKVKELSALGITKHGFEVQLYDDYLYGNISDYQGILGLDFFEGTRFTVDMVENTIEVENL